MPLSLGEAKEAPPPAVAATRKDPAAVALACKGGLEGGAARAKALSAKRGTEIAKKPEKPLEGLIGPCACRFFRPYRMVKKIYTVPA